MNRRWSGRLTRAGRGRLCERFRAPEPGGCGGSNPLAHQILGGALLFDDDLVGARRQLELAYRAWKDAGELRAAALVAVDLADLHWSGFGNRAAGQGWISRARRLLASEGRCVEQGYAELTFIACEDDVSRLEQAAAMALELAVEFGDTDLEVLALADSGYALVVQGRGTEGLARLDEAMAALSACGRGRAAELRHVPPVLVGFERQPAAAEELVVAGDPVDEVDAIVAGDRARQREPGAEFRRRPPRRHLLVAERDRGHAATDVFNAPRQPALRGVRAPGVGQALEPAGAVGEGHDEPSGAEGPLVERERPDLLAKVGRVGGEGAIAGDADERVLHVEPFQVRARGAAGSLSGSVRSSRLPAPYGTT